MNIPIAQIRDDFDFYYSKYKAAANHVKELADDIAKNGLKEPIEIHKIGDHFYEVVNGVHRFRAIKTLGWIEVECVILDYGPQARPHSVGRYG